MLGERTVNGRVDRDRIDVGRYEGRFSKLTIVVQDSDMELLEFKVVFADKSTYDPKLAHYFKEGQRTHVIDLPPGESVIRTIDLKYRNLRGGGDAKVQVWGFKTGNAVPPPVRVDWDSRGWEMLGERTVNGRVDRDRIDVGKNEGRFNKLTLVVLDSDMELLEFKVQFGDRENWDPRLTHYFREGSRTRVLDLPGGARAIHTIDLKYRNIPGGGNARVQVWGFKTVAAPIRVDWDSRGWTMLGERTVNGRVDRDRIDVGRYEGKFNKLTVVVLDSDLELLEFKVQFGDRSNWDPRVAHYFREGQRTRVIDLPPGERVIRTIDLKYRNLPGGGQAKVQVWAFKVADATPARVEWDSRGWVMLGERQVDGRVDRDRIEVGRQEGKFSKLTLVALDNDLELIDFEVKFKRGEPWHPDVKHYFKEGARTRVIDLPGDDRTIQYIEFKYRNLERGRRAKLQVWAFKTR